MAVAAETSTPAPPADRDVRKVRIVCSHCDRVFVRYSRRGYTARCPHCETVNAGPALLREQGKPKAEGARRRVQRREARAERAAGAAGESITPSTSTPAPAPVRRKRTGPPAAAQASGTPAKDPGTEGAAAPAAPPPPPRRRGLLGTLMYGGGEDDDGE